MRIGTPASAGQIRDLPSRFPIQNDRPVVPFLIFFTGRSLTNQVVVLLFGPMAGSSVAKPRPPFIYTFREAVAVRTTGQGLSDHPDLELKTPCPVQSVPGPLECSGSFKKIIEALANGLTVFTDGYAFEHSFGIGPAGCPNRPFRAPQSGADARAAQMNARRR